MRFVIVGQGISGTMLSWHLLKKGADVTVADEYQPNSSSHIAGGLMNPITGRRFVKTWMADTIFPFAETVYHEMESVLNVKFLHPIPIHKILYTTEAINDWSTRCGDAQYKPYLSNETLFELDQKFYFTKHAFEINGGFWVNSTLLLNTYRQWLKNQNRLIEGYHTWQELQHQFTDAIIVFCNGVVSQEKSPFAAMPFTPTKGEVLMVEIPDFKLPAVINGEITLLATAQPHIFYAGATMHQRFDNDKPSESGLYELKAALDATLKVPYKVVDHLASVRPAVKDRRPLVGFHHTSKNMAIFNGMGTKGFSLSPYLASTFTDTLLEGNTIVPEINVARFL